MTPGKTTAQQFKKWRMKMGWDRADAARFLGIGVTSVYNYESGRRSDVAAPVLVPRVISLAAAALQAGLSEVGD